MRVLIDADGCPVVNITVELAKKAGVECLILCDTAHHFAYEGVQTLVFSQGADSVDYALVNMVKQGDIIVTQDYGLAAMALAKKGIPVSQNGMIYHDGNIDGLLASRHINQKLRRSGKRVKGPAKRTAEQDEAFRQTLSKLFALDAT